MRCFYHVFIGFTGINTDMMFLHLHFSRNKTVTGGNDIRELFPAFFAEFRCKFFFTQIMVDTLPRKTGNIRFPFSGLLLSNCFLFQIIWFWRTQVTDCLRLIKEYNRSIYFHEANLVRILHFFTGTAKAVFVGKNQLLHHLLHFCI